MAGEIQLDHHETGIDAYVVFIDKDGKYWNTTGTPAYETKVVANWAEYYIIIEETPAGGYLYIGDIPATVPAGVVTVLAFEQATAGPLITDHRISLPTELDWDGTVVIPHSVAAIVDEWETQSQDNPTGFHVNVKEVNDTPQTANDNSADIILILEDTGTTIPATLSSMAGATFNTATDSLEAIRNRGDAAWLTATTVTVTAIANDVITAASINTGAFTADAFAADALVAATFATGSFTADAFAADALVAATFAASSLNGKGDWSTATALAAHDIRLGIAGGLISDILIDTMELQENQGDWLTATGFSTHNAVDVVTALMNDVGITPGGTFTYEQIMKIIVTTLAGRVRDKVGSPGTYQVLDPDNDSTVIVELTPSQSTPYRSTVFP